MVYSLTSLAHIHVPDETTNVDTNEVVDKFTLSGRHKLNFLPLTLALFAFIVRQLIV
jgi:hypothetical protein